MLARLSKKMETHLVPVLFYGLGCGSRKFSAAGISQVPHDTLMLKGGLSSPQILFDNTPLDSHHEVADVASSVVANSVVEQHKANDAPVQNFSSEEEDNFNEDEIQLRSTSILNSFSTGGSGIRNYELLN